MAADDSVKRYRNFFQDFFADDDDNDDDTRQNDILDMHFESVEDVRELVQAAQDREFESDVDEGWSREAREPVNAPFTGQVKLNASLPENPEPLDFFQLFVDDSIIEKIVVETNRYAERKIEAEDLKENSRMHRWTPDSLYALVMSGFTCVIVTLF